MKTTTTIGVGALARYRRMTGVVFALCVGSLGDDKLGVLLYRYRQHTGLAHGRVVLKLLCARIWAPSQQTSSRGQAYNTIIYSKRWIVRLRRQVCAILTLLC